jgi:hypothetical protein
MAAATARVVSAALAVLIESVCATGATFDWATFADGCAAVVTTFAAPTDVVGVGAVAVATVVVCDDFDSVFAGVEVGCSGASPEAAGSFDFGSVWTPVASFVDSAVPVCAPPLLLTVTPEPTSVLEDVAPEVVVLPVAAVSAPVGVDDEEVDSEPPPVAIVVEDSGAEVSLDVDVDVDPAVVADDSEDVPVVSAAETP